MEHARRRGRGCARLDLRGHGDSSGVAGDVTLTEMIQDAACAVERFGPGLLVGSSMGAIVAAWLAARRPEGIDGLVLLAPAIGFLSRLAADGRLTTTEGREVVLSDRVVRDLAGYDERELPGRLDLPVLIVHGSEDEVVPAALGQGLHDAIPHDRKDLWIVPGGDHRLHRPIGEILRRMDAFHG